MSISETRPVSDEEEGEFVVYEISPEKMLREQHKDLRRELAQKRAQKEQLRHEIKKLVEEEITLGRAVAVFDRAAEAKGDTNAS